MFCDGSILIKSLARCLSTQVGTKQADVAMDTERKRRVDDTVKEEEIARRVNIANRLLDVQKELLSTHQQVKVVLSLKINRQMLSLKC